MVTLAALALMISLGMVITRKRMAAIGRTVNMERGPLSPALDHVLRDPLLSISIQTRVAMALGIVFLMTVKPGLIGSLLTIGVATVLGLVSALPVLGRERTQGASAKRKQA